MQRNRANVDKFMAAAVGTAAYEVPDGDSGKKVNAFTHCFLKAFASPDSEMIRNVDEDGEAIKVVPNRRLGKYLQREVAKLLGDDIARDQRPDAEVLSDDDVYIGRVKPSPPPPSPALRDTLKRLSHALNDVLPESFDIEYGGSGYGERRTDSREPQPPSAPIVNLRDVASLAVDRALNQQLQISADKLRAIEDLGRESGFDSAVANAGETVADVTHFKTGTGFTVVGAAIAEAASANGEGVAVLKRADGHDRGVVQVDLHHPVPACTVMVLFTDGHGTALAALNGYVGHVVVEDGRVMNVNYVPSENSDRWREYLPRKEKIDKLRAAAAAAVRYGVFRLDDKQEASKLAGHIRIEKGLDPTLGIYAAYAYSEADRRKDISSVLNFMRGDLHCDLFDIAMLARNVSKNSPLLVPFCPILTQGWNLLRTRGIELPAVLDEAQDELEQALWTTFKPERARAIFEATRRGELTNEALARAWPEPRR